MLSVTADELHRQRREVRRTVQRGDAVALTFRGKAYGYVVSAEQWERAEEALAWYEAAEREAEAA